MMKLNVLFFAATLAISMNASATSPMMPPPKPTSYKVTGIQAEFLFGATSEFDSVTGLEGTADCAMGTCGTLMKDVMCKKHIVDSADPALDIRTLECTVKSPTTGKPVAVSYRDNAAVSELRRALIEITGELNSTADENSNFVRVKSIECTAHSINREMDSLEFESTYECTVEI